jgi:hypothetical protein
MRNSLAALRSNALLGDATNPAIANPLCQLALFSAFAAALVFPQTSRPAPSGFALAPPPRLPRTRSCPAAHLISRECRAGVTTRCSGQLPSTVARGVETRWRIVLEISPSSLTRRWLLPSAMAAGC